MSSLDDIDNQNIVITMREMWKFVNLPTRNKQVNNALVTDDFTSEFDQLLSNR